MEGRNRSQKKSDIIQIMEKRKKTMKFMMIASLRSYGLEEDQIHNN